MLPPSALTGACASPDSEDLDLEDSTYTPNHIFFLPKNIFSLSDPFDEPLIKEKSLFANYTQSPLNLHDDPFYTFADLWDESSWLESQPSQEATIEEQSTGETRKSPGRGKQFRRSPSVQERRERLLEALRAGVVQNSGMLNDLYKARQSQVFHADILNLMRDGNNIVKTEGGFRCHGTIDLPKCRPTKPLAVAMFDILQKGWVSKFDVAFSLSLEGYRQEPPLFIAILEVALIVAEVHPSRRQIKTQTGTDITDKLKKLWKEIRDKPESSLAHLMQDELPYHYSIMRQLYRLQQTNVLSILEAKKKDMISSALQYDEKQIVFKQTICKVLSANKNTPFDLRRLCRDLQPLIKGVRESVPLYEFTNSAIELVFEGVPIVYNSEKKTIMVADPAPEVTTPPAKTNLLTLVYNCVCVHEKALNMHEIAYHAHTMGYWHVNNKVLGRGKEHLLKEVLQTKRALIVLGLTSITSSARKDRADINRWRKLWTDTQKLSTATPKDLKVIAQIKTLVDSPEYAVLLDHIKSKREDHQWTDNQKHIKNLLSTGGVTVNTLQQKCQDFGMKSAQFWEALAALTEKKTTGRVIFKLDEGYFIWDETSSFKEQHTVYAQTDLFRIRSRCRYFSPELIAFILQQRGFKGMSGQTVRHAILGLQVLGLWAEYECKCERDFSPQRCLLNAILGKDKESLQVQEGCKIWRRGSVERIPSWIRSGAIEQLWEAYIEERNQDQELPPPAKQQKLHKQRIRPDKIIATTIPELKKFFVEKNLWPYDVFSD